MNSISSEKCCSVVLFLGAIIPWSIEYLVTPDGRYAMRFGVGGCMHVVYWRVLNHLHWPADNDDNNKFSVSTGPGIQGRGPLRMPSELTPALASSGNTRRMTAYSTAKQHRKRIPAPLKLRPYGAIQICLLLLLLLLLVFIPQVV